MHKIAFIGNIFSGDDGVGIRLYEELRTRIDTEIIALEDGLDLANYVKDDDSLIIIDAVQGTPGKVMALRHDEIDDSRKITIHDVGVIEAVALLKRLRNVKVNIIGIGIGSVSQSETLSQEIINKWPQIRQETIKQINRLVK